MVASLAQLGEVAVDIPAVAIELASCFWPGALTLVVHRHPSVPEAVTGGLSTVAVRQPDHLTPLALIAACGAPITGTSANYSGGPQPASAQEVVRQLGDAVDMVLDGGTCPGGVPSTILDVTVSPPTVLRLGAVSVERLRAVCAVAVAGA